MNAWAIRERILREIGFPRSALGSRISQSALFNQIQEAETKALRRLHIPDLARVTLDVTGESRVVSIGIAQGIDMVGWLIRRVVFTDTDGDEHVLSPTSLETMDRSRRGWRDATSVSTDIPRNYWPDYATNSLYLDPAPGTTDTDALSVEFVRRPWQQFIVYETGTVTVGYGDTAVVGSGTSWSTYSDFATSLHFGVLPSVSSVDNDPMPIRWYRVSAIGGDTALTIPAGFSEPDVSGASYVLASRSTLIEKHSDLAPILIAYGQAFAFGNNREFQMRDQKLAEFNVLLEEAEGTVHILPDMMANATMGFSGEFDHDLDDYTRSHARWA